jgi:hypothetical protein
MMRSGEEQNLAIPCHYSVRKQLLVLAQTVFTYSFENVMLRKFLDLTEGGKE